MTRVPIRPSKIFMDLDEFKSIYMIFHIFMHFQNRHNFRNMCAQKLKLIPKENYESGLSNGWKTRSWGHLFKKLWRFWNSLKFNKIHKKNKSKIMVEKIKITTRVFPCFSMFFFVFCGLIEFLDFIVIGNLRLQYQIMGKSIRCLIWPKWSNL